MQAWAETTSLQAELARRVWRRDRTRIAGIGIGTSVLVTDWIRWRLAQLKPIMNTRGERCA